MELVLPKLGLTVKKKLKVGKLPLEVDLVVIRRVPGQSVGHPLWDHLAPHSLVEFKSIADPFHLAHWHRLLSYGGLYRNQEKLSAEVEVALWLVVPMFPEVLRRYMTGVTAWEPLLSGVERGRYGHYEVIVVAYNALPDAVAFDPLALFAPGKAPAIVWRLFQDDAAASELIPVAEILYRSIWEDAVKR
jgi:hypothetical protein